MNPGPGTVQRPLLPLWAAVGTAAVGGFTLDGAFPDLGWWPLAFPAVAFALVSLVGRSIGGALLVGLVYGTAFFAVDVLWTARYLGPVPWMALTLFEALLMGVGAIGIALVYRWAPVVLRRRSVRRILIPLIVAALWTAREIIMGSWPYGGFPWGRVGMSQAAGPLADAVSWVGVSGLTFLMVALCAAVVEFVREPRDRWALAPAAVVAVLLVAVPSFPTTAAGSVRIGAVQGNGPSGYFDERQRGEVLAAQVAATRPLVGEQVDLVVWPEGGIDSDPFANRATAATLDIVRERVDAPLLVNAPTVRGDQVYNESILWTAEGPTQTYDKMHPVPFGEYVPDRAFFRAFAPDLIDLIGRDYTPGTSAPWMEVGGTRIGLAICFDVIYDDVIWASARDGAAVYVFQTNNADFRGTDENLQQLEVARMRARETGRSVVNLSTVGTSQVIAPDGSVVDGLPAGEAGAMVTDVPLRSGLTPASVVGPALQWVVGAGSAVTLVVFGLLSRRRTRLDGKTKASSS